MISLAHPPTGSRYHFPSFTALSFQRIHSYIPGIRAPAQPSQVPEGRPAYLPFLWQGPRTLLSSHSESGKNYPRKEQSSLTSEITNTLEHINHMQPLPNCRLKGNSTKALTLIPITRSSSVRLSHQQSAPRGFCTTGT